MRKSIITFYPKAIPVKRIQNPRESTERFLIPCEIRGKNVSSSYFIFYMIFKSLLDPDPDSSLPVLSHNVTLYVLSFGPIYFT